MNNFFQLLFGAILTAEGVNYWITDKHSVATFYLIMGVGFLVHFLFELFRKEKKSEEE